jgi:hypothetical protein
MLKVILLVAVGLVVVLAIGFLLYGRSKVQPDGTLLISGEAPLSASVEQSFDRILSKDGLRAWWLGPIGKIETSAGWPAPGEKMTFEMGSSPVTYVSQAVERPRKHVTQAQYPDTTTTVTQEFLGAGEGGPLYRKTLVVRLKPGTSALKTWMLGAVIALSVPSEVKRAAEFAGRK